MWTSGIKAAICPLTLYSSITRKCANKMVWKSRAMYFAKEREGGGRGGEEKEEDEKKKEKK